MKPHVWVLMWHDWMTGEHKVEVFRLSRGMYARVEELAKEWLASPPTKDPFDFAEHWLEVQ